ncbi:unnamed protein product [Cuscuta epithymum]|uniref:Vacuolar protein sorting-associated protein 62 n=1 Tax=Cuscuta epithymum TaxID=186058 RepID=A0AAV0FBB4_9ASTE|nr:unnamed protein product [Cuscuta epithymum]
MCRSPIGLHRRLLIIRFRFSNVCSRILRLVTLGGAKMLGCKCLSWTQVACFSKQEQQTFSLPAPIPEWPQGTGFGTGIIKLGEIEVCQIIKFEFVWGSNLSSYGGGTQGVSFYKPTGLPQGFFNLGYYAQPNANPLQGFVLGARAVLKSNHGDDSPPLQDPEDYTLLWCSNDGPDDEFDVSGYFWLPQPPEGYKSLGFVVTNKPAKPELCEVKCVRDDLTDPCETHHVMLKTYSKFSQTPILVCNTRPCYRGKQGRGVSVGTFFCSEYLSLREELGVVCLKNFDEALHAMPNLDQIHALIRHYGPTVFFHPDEVYLPSSVSWFFENGALLCKKGDGSETIDPEGSNLPAGGTNDGEYWIDLPRDSRRGAVKQGNIRSAKLYVHVKPAMGGTFTDIVMWIFCPFNGPATLKVGVLNFVLGKVGQHVGDWEHFTLRLSNFTGELQRIYFSQHSGGEWVNIYDLEFIEGNKAVIYSSKHGHASYPHPGVYIQGSSALGVGIRNDASRSNNHVDSSVCYEIVSAEYLGNGVVVEPCWLQYMREWGPTVVYDSMGNRLPMSLRVSAQSIFNKLPGELCGEAGPSGPKEKNNWTGDERW